MDNEYLNKLNPQQRDAVVYTGGPELVIAGAGSGKTRVLTYKIVHLLHEGLDPHRIMALTFTNKAADEMRSRITPLVGDRVSRQLWMGTFHSIFSRILRTNAEAIGFKHDFTIYDTADSRSLIKLIIKDMNLDDKVYKPNSLQATISNLKNALISPHDYEANRSFREADNRSNRPLTYVIYNTYWNRCRVAGAMDFDDLLFYTNILLRDNADVRHRYQEFFQYILVDEYQDTNFAQHLIVSQLSKQHNMVCMVGDDAQSIYSFRGANISNILSLSKQYPNLRTFKLERNYRSTQYIIKAANSLIEKNKQQIKKNIFSENAIGHKIPVIECYSDYEEGYVVANRIISLKHQLGCPYSDFAVLYRTNAQSRVLEEALSNGGKRDSHSNSGRVGIPYRIYGGLSFYQRKEVKDVLSYMRLAVNPDDDEALRRIINYPARGIGAATLAKVQAAAMQAHTSMWNVLTSPQQFNLNVNKGTQAKLDGFTSTISKFVEMNANATDATTIARTIINDTRILALLQGDHTPENISRQENINELLNSVNDFVNTRLEEGSSNISLNDFLSLASLATDQDSDDDPENSGDRVTLMTVHAAKGLEFRNVFIVGVEEDLFPSLMSQNSESEIEEERRLLYVAITRAKENCIITFADSRFMNGKTKTCNMSRFLRDIDPQYLNMAKRSTSYTPTRISYTSSWQGSPRRADALGHSSSPSYSSATSTQAGNSSPSSITAKPRVVRQVSSATRATANVAGNFANHEASELSVGTRICHSRFGEGNITSIDTSGSDAKIVVMFDQLGEKTLLLKFAKFEIL